ncbi:hypothetical protein [Photobacterium lutimaris]|uniref:Right handed beta helix domain-containing protein n=1 Tax=Photobacterium lutimaris TaxID=388278 RepID=A0A2T3J2U2_9GAMM|nr:hypothetical protein [Photobacterium lutimaris]PSU35573.1 hypothetical protein C9I99_00695 [Photobacterium lutimaris]TDR78624.1 hypothetical protein DFP78_101136 [Photobacterium lutimaris]
MKKVLKLYFLFCGLMANAFLFTALILFIDKIPSQLSQAASKVSDKINAYSPESAHYLSTLTEQPETEDYYKGKFRPTQWPTVGPQKQYQLFNTHRFVHVNSEIDLITAIKNARPGDEIVIQNGNYLLEGKRFVISEARTSPHTPIVVRAATLGRVNLYLDAVEGFVIDQPNWQIEGINFIGQCDNHSRCEHALHIVGAAKNTVIRNNTFYDFNAALKINELNNIYPDNGIVESNIFGMNEPRHTHHSVTPINLDHGNNWQIRQNLIHDFIKLDGNKISYGAYMKGGIHGGTIEQNLIICNTKPTQFRGSQVGLSFGGGGMNKQDRRGKSDFEVTNSVMKNNIIMHCNDVGIYSPRVKDIVINNNILYNTLGIDIRFQGSTAAIFNNILDGRIKDRDSAKSDRKNNYIDNNSLFSSSLSLKTVFEDPNQGNFRLKQLEALRKAILDAPALTESSVDFCNSTVRAGQSYVGAIYDETGCFKPSY